MVNNRFPRRIGYGFEMVTPLSRPSQRQRPVSIENLHRFKSLGFFADFSPNARGLTDRQILPLYRHMSKMIAGSNATLSKRNGRGREMLFLLRMTFWLGLVLVLLPREKTPESDKLPQVGASEAVSAATAAVSDMSQFCKRQPAACDVGGQAASVIGQRAQDGARKLYRIITDKRPPEHTGSIGGTARADAAAAFVRDTLTPDDLEAEWRGVP
jgi:hypothetical protein